MSLRLEMLGAARAGRSALADAADAVVAFARSRVGPGGGFRGRSDAEDLYYTVFGMGVLLALEAELPERLGDYLHGFGGGEELDFVHVTCLARCWANLPCGPPAAAARALQRRLRQHLAPDGGFGPRPDPSQSTAYACFLGVGACEDLDMDVPDPGRLLACLEGFRTPDGGYADTPGQATGITPITAGMVVLRRHLSLPGDAGLNLWIVDRLHPAGGFLVTAEAPIPEMVSTATALYALAPRLAGLEAVRRSCLRFCETVWSESAGGFGGHALDDTADCEYTWYGLMVLGLLSV